MNRQHFKIGDGTVRAVFVVLTLALGCPVAGYAQAGSAARSIEPFKVGTFQAGTRAFVGMVVRDRFVVDVAEANAALEKSRSFPKRAIPSEMVGVISEYENGLKQRLYAIVNETAQGNALTASRPAYIRELKD